MKERILGFVKTYLFFVLVFVLQKVVFMCYHAGLYASASGVDRLRVLWHGLPLDLSMSAYLTALPGLFYMATFWTVGQALRTLWRVYFFIVSMVMAVVFVVDIVLYGFWGFRLDATAVFYFLSSPSDTLSSVSPWFVILGFIVMALLALLLYKVMVNLLIGWRSYRALRVPYQRVTPSLIMLLLTGLLFIPLRGGFTVSTMNTGRAYFSTDMRLNHAATNPLFNLMESLSKQKDFAKQYRFMDADEADRLFATLVDPQVSEQLMVRDEQLILNSEDSSADSLAHASLARSADPLLRTRRPDICLVVLEGFSSQIMASLGGQADVAVCMDSLSQHGILFTHFYANSFRTDRGLVSILSGYPAQPNTSIMKYPRKTQGLPSIAGSLHDVGYATHYYYGGDADFTNMRSYLMASGFEDLVEDTDFPTSERLSKWGVHDHLLFQRYLDDMQEEASTYDTDNLGRQPQFRVIQTSSSHEPFDVPYRRLNDDILNAFAYTDSCVGDFVHQYSQLPQWDNTLLIFVPDHLGAIAMSNFVPQRYQIPLLLAGGAIARPRTIDTYGSQHDIAATLLAQLGLTHAEFTFSKDMMNPHAPHFAFFTVPDAFGMASEDNMLIFDNGLQDVVVDEGENKGHNLRAGQAYLQKLYDDLGAR